MGFCPSWGAGGGGAGLAWLIPRAVRTLAGVQEAMPLTLLCTQSPELPAVVGPAGKAPVQGQAGRTWAMEFSAVARGSRISLRTTIQLCHYPAV